MHIISWNLLVVASNTESFVLRSAIFVVLKYVKGKEVRPIQPFFAVRSDDSKGSTATENLSRQIQMIQNAASMDEKPSGLCLRTTAAKTAVI
jgi:hypothetical protein